MKQPYRVIPEEAIFDYLRGDSLQEIADRYGVYKQAIHNFLIRNFVALRAQGRPKKQAKLKPFVPPPVPPFRSGLCSCLGRGAYTIGNQRVPCPACARIARMWS